jgi:magnesium transporter
VSFRVLTVGPDGPAVETTGDADVGPPPKGSWRWIDLCGESSDHAEAELDILQKRFDFHPLTIEDCAHFDQRPKLEEYGAYLFIVMHGFILPNGKLTSCAPVELHAFLGEGYLVTVHTEPMAQLSAIWKRAAGDASLARRGADFLYYLVVDEIVDANFAILDQISDALDDIEDAVLAWENEHAKRKELAAIFALKRTLVILRRTLSPQRDIFAMVSKRGDARISERTSLYFRDVYDHLTRIYESIDTARDLLGNALDAYLSMVAQRTNEIMKRLTILSAVFLPLTFVTGFFGQNFDALPIHEAWVMYVAFAICVVVPAAMLFWFWRRKWIG